MTEQPLTTRRIGWLGVFQWTALTLVGVALAGGLHFPGSYGTLRWSEVEFDLSAGVSGFIFGGVSGLFIAGLQALLLRAWGGPDRAWIVFNIVGYGLVHAIADAAPYRLFTIVGGGIIVAVCQYLALRRALAHAGWWLPLVAGAWWLGFGLSAGPEDYNFIVVALLLGPATGLALRLFLIPADPPAPNRWWSSLSRPLRVLLVIGLVAGLAMFLVVFAGLTGLTGLF